MTKFNKRPMEMDSRANEEVKICDCGHADYEHELPIGHQKETECHECMCPFFNLQHKIKHIKYLQQRYGT